jgi:hypothetical protein
MEATRVRKPASPSVIDSHRPVLQHSDIMLERRALAARDAKTMNAITLVLLSVLIAACATHPAAMGADPSSKVAAADAVAPGTPTSIAAVDSQPADNSNVVDPSILKRGYKAVHRNGQLLYCRSQILTGTHFTNTVCSTAAQVNAAERERQGILDQLGKAHGVDCHAVKCQ